MCSPPIRMTKTSYMSLNFKSETMPQSCPLLTQAKSLKITTAKQKKEKVHSRVCAYRLNVQKRDSFILSKSHSNSAVPAILCSIDVLVFFSILITPSQSLKNTASKPKPVTQFMNFRPFRHPHSNPIQKILSTILTITSISFNKAGQKAKTETFKVPSFSFFSAAKQKYFLFFHSNKILGFNYFFFRKQTDGKWVERAYTSETAKVRPVRGCGALGGAGCGGGRS